MIKSFYSKGSILLICIFLIIAIGWIPIFGLHRPYVNWFPTDLAQYLVDHNRSAQECFDLIWFELMAPSQAEQRALCVYEYAALSKDPSVCALLMPSRYGLDCVGEAREPDQCNFYQGEVSWVENSTAYKLPYTSCTVNDVRRSAMANACCTIAMVTFMTSQNDCSSL